MRVGVYVDAFNVYYGGRALCGRGTPGWRWLDLTGLTVSLIDQRLWSNSRLVKIVYCTALRDREGNVSSLTDQKTYIAALRQHSSIVEVVSGIYAPRTKSGVLVDRNERRVPSPGSTELPRWLPAIEVLGPDGRTELRTSITTFEEKGSDVNVASHLLIDVLTDQVDAAVVLSNDSDLAFPLEQARLRAPLGTVNPRKNPTAMTLRGRNDDGVGRHWWRRLKASDLVAHQLPDRVGRLRKPEGW
ncbi:MAG: NYN domain-containing protein [Pseudonocardiales bacterium]|nr:NYN domain-containing protein [Pseudonocardiales bacterium]